MCWRVCSRAVVSGADLGRAANSSVLDCWRDDCTSADISCSFITSVCTTALLLPLPLPPLPLPVPPLPPPPLPVASSPPLSALRLSCALIHAVASKPSASNSLRVMPALLLNALPPLALLGGGAYVTLPSTADGALSAVGEDDMGRGQPSARRARQPALAQDDAEQPGSWHGGLCGRDGDSQRQ